jgi:hypothetical protein
MERAISLRHHLGPMNVTETHERGSGVNARRTGNFVHPVRRRLSRERNRRVDRLASSESQACRLGCSRPGPPR